jgi:uncharacterized protein (TIGR02453 family)
MDIESFPPFEGFPREGISFLRRLKKNNNREWFNKHKTEYEELVKFPMQTFISSMKQPMEKLAPEIQVDENRSLFRIYRDTRFSKNKTPYKTHVAAVFHLKGHWEETAGFYVHIEPGGVYVGGGIYMPDSDQLKRIRAAIAEKSDEFLAIMKNKIFRKTFNALEGEKLQRAPLGYPKAHPMIEWLKHKSFYTGVEWKEEACYSRNFLSNVVNVYSDLLPLIRFLNDAVKRS